MTKSHLLKFFFVLQGIWGNLLNLNIFTFKTNNQTQALDCCKKFTPSFCIVQDDETLPEMFVHFGIEIPTNDI